MDKERAKALGQLFLIFAGLGTAIWFVRKLPPPPKARARAISCGCGVIKVKS